MRHLAIAVKTCYVFVVKVLKIFKLFAGTLLYYHENSFTVTKLLKFCLKSECCMENSGYHLIFCAITITEL